MYKPTEFGEWREMVVLEPGSETVGYASIWCEEGPDFLEPEYEVESDPTTRS